MLSPEVQLLRDRIEDLHTGLAQMETRLSARIDALHPTCDAHETRLRDLEQCNAKRAGESSVFIALTSGASAVAGGLIHAFTRAWLGH